jgi:uncharacterized OB-fold protein
MAERDFNSTSFYQFLAEEKLMGSHCNSCKAQFLPPRALCPSCYGEDMEWIEMPAEGKLVAYTTIHIAPTAMIEAGYDRENPYCAGIVELANGTRISAQILGVPAAQPEAIAIGAPVHAVFVKRGEGESEKAFLAFDSD